MQHPNGNPVTVYHGAEVQLEGGSGAGYVHIQLGLIAIGIQQHYLVAIQQGGGNGEVGLAGVLCQTGIKLEADADNLFAVFQLALTEQQVALGCPAGDGLAE